MTPEFRAWNKRIKTMITDYHIPYYDDVYGVLLSDVFDDSQVVFEQYTGLKDVNGNKIFEGDIVISGWNEMQEGGPDLFIEAKGQVAFDEGCFGVYDNEQGFRPLFTMTLNKLHVIGNIHENPELLEVEK